MHNLKKNLRWMVTGLCCWQASLRAADKHRVERQGRLSGWGEREGRGEGNVSCLETGGLPACPKPPSLLLHTLHCPTHTHHMLNHHLFPTVCHNTTQHNMAQHQYQQPSELKYFFIVVSIHSGLVRQTSFEFRLNSS